MALLVETKRITSIRALGTWYWVDPDSVEIDCIEIVHSLEDGSNRDLPLMQQNLMIYQFAAEFKSANEIKADLPKSQNPRWAYDYVTHNLGIRFFDNDLGEVVTMPLCLVEAFACLPAFDHSHLDAELTTPDESIAELEKRWGISRNALKARARALGVELIRQGPTLTLWPGDWIAEADRLDAHLKAGGTMASFPSIAGTDGSFKLLSEVQGLEFQKAKRKPISSRLRYQVLLRDGHRCVDCGASPADDSSVRLEIDHRVPVSRGGSNDIDNLQTLCWACNHGKSDSVDHKLNPDAWGNAV